jgi:hypothetical protein
VQVEDRRIVSVEHRAVDVLRWAPVEVDTTGASTLADIVDGVRACIADAAQAAEGRPVLLRLTLAGTTGLHAAMLADPVAVAAECRNAAIAEGEQTWIESVRLRTRAPRMSAVVPESADALALLARSFQEALDDGGVRDSLLSDMKSLLNRLPAGLADLDVPRTEAELRALAPEAWLIVAHALAEGEPA